LFRVLNTLGDDESLQRLHRDSRSQRDRD